MAPNAGEEQAPRTTTPEGYQVVARAVEAYDERARGVLGRQRNDRYSGMVISLLCRAPAGADVVTVGMKNIRAEDDLGHSMVSADVRYGYLARQSDLFPDEQELFAPFAERDPRARQLRWLTADLYACRRRRVQFSIPLPLEKRVVAQRSGDLIFAVSD